MTRRADFSMDHLLLSHGAAVSESDGPPYVADIYDGGPFVEYPKRSRFRQLYEIYMPDSSPAFAPQINGLSNCRDGVLSSDMAVLQDVARILWIRGTRGRVHRTSK